MTRSALRLGLTIARPLAPARAVVPALRASEQVPAAFASGAELQKGHPTMVEAKLPRVDDMRVLGTFASSAVEPKGVTLLRAGNVESDGIEVVAAETARGALYTSRGPNTRDHGVRYASYNEDAAFLSVHPATEQRDEVVCAGAFDQAGGMDQIPGRKGATSRTAALRFARAANLIASGKAPVETLTACASLAHAEIAALNAKLRKTATTTMAAGVVLDGRAHVVNVGDSQALHFSMRGELLNKTSSHNRGELDALESGDPNASLERSNILTRALGQWGPAPHPDIYEWRVSPGQFLIFASDGLLDAHLAEHEAACWAGDAWDETAGDKTVRKIGEIVGRAPSVEVAAEQLRDLALGNMADGLGKPDNLTFVVLRIE